MSAERNFLLGIVPGLANAKPLAAEGIYAFIKNCNEIQVQVLNDSPTMQNIFFLFIFLLRFHL